MISREDIGKRGLFDGGFDFLNEFEATIVEVSPSGERIKLKNPQSGYFYWKMASDLRIKEWLPPLIESSFSSQGANTNLTKAEGLVEKLGNIYLDICDGGGCSP